MIIDQSDDGTATVELERYGDLLSARTLPEWRFISEDPPTIATRVEHLASAGILATPDAHKPEPYPEYLFDYQRWIIDRALERERFAVFADCGLGKTAVQLEWARQVLHATAGRVLIVAPLQVVGQTIEEAHHFYEDFPIVELRDAADVQDFLAERPLHGGIVGVTNYEKIDGLNVDKPLPVAGVVLDESSILKQSMGARRTALMRAFAGVRWKLCCTATPAPNDRVEYAQHALFLDVVRSAREFLARFFINRDGDWQLKHHGETAFYRHLASWSVFMRSPAAYRFADNAVPQHPVTVRYPHVALTVEQSELARDYEAGTQASLFGATPGGIVSRTKVMQIAHGFLLDGKGGIAATVPSGKADTIANLCNVEHGDEQVIVWVTFDEEARRLGERIPDAAVISGKTPKTKRAELIGQFRVGEGPRVLIAKPSMLGHGLNLQACRIQVFSTITDSFERFYQAVRRSHRYGQTRPVLIYIPLTALDEAMCRNVLSKELVWREDGARQEQAYVDVLRPRDDTERRVYVTEPQAELDRVTADRWTMIHGDAIAHMETMPDEVVALAVFSPPFANLFTYSSDLADMGNVREDAEYRLQWRWFAERLLRVMKPGRVVAVHCMDIIRFAGQHGVRHTYDYPSDLRAGMQDAGFYYRARISIDKNPQVQATRTKDANLLFITLKRNALDSHPQAGEYVLVFTTPGEAETPVIADGISNKEWIAWAHHIWYDIRETDVLNAELGREHEDERHICLARGSLVLTRDGYVPIETVAVGDLVLTHRGRWRPVLAKRCNGVQPILQTCAQGVADLRTTPDHELFVRRGAGPRAKAQALAADAGWVAASDSLGSYVNLKLPPVEESPLTEDEWWIVGRWLGDGHRGTLRAGHGGAPIVLSCAHGELPGLQERLGPHSGHVATLTASQVVLRGLRPEVRAVIDRCGKGAAGKRLPAEAVTLAAAKAEALLSGYLSADGHYVARHDRWMASSVSRPLLLGMALVAQRARGVVASVYAGRPPRKHTIEGRVVQARQDWIFSFRNSPGYRQSGWVGDDGAWKKVRRSRETDSAEVWDLRVADDASFTAEGCVVKNCPLQLGLIERVVRLWSNAGELVFSPFAGIGSEGVVSLEWGRRFYGVELKRSYFDAAARLLGEKERDVDGRLAFGESPAAVDTAPL